MVFPNIGFVPLEGDKLPRDSEKRMRFLLLTLLPFFACLCAATYPIDRGAVADVVFDLGGQWALDNGTTHVFGRVPGDLITDLENSGVIGDPLYELNFKSAAWDRGKWVFLLLCARSTTLPP